MRSLAAAAALAAAGGALVIGCAVLQARPDFPERAEIYAEPVEISPGELRGLRLRGSVVLTSNHPAVGGVSGLLIDGGELIAVTDHAWLIRSPLADDAQGLRPVGIKVFPLRDTEGRRLDDAGRDAEGLARTADGLAVSFERDHRIEFIEGDRLARTISDRAFEQLGYNKGLEALATLPDGRLLAIAEASATGGFPAFIIDPEAGTVRSRRLPLPGALPVTGADVGPDGRLYVLRRDFSLLGGFSIAIERYRLAPDGLPMPETREQLASFGGASGIDNMEAITLWRDDAGRTRLAIASDDNFRFLQRTLLLDFEVVD